VANATSVETDLLVSAAITGAGGLTKAGAGTLEMSGASTYAGTTTVNAGTLLVTGSISGAVTTAGGTLAGTGSVGAITANSGTIAPGASIGTLTASALTMSASATFALEIDTSTTATDLLSTSGPLTLDLTTGTPLTLADLGGNVSLAQGTKFTFLTYSGAQSGFFSFGGSPIGDDVDSFLFGTNLFAINYNDLGGTAVSLVVVPEPGIAVSLLGGFGMLVGLQRIRRRRAR
jgi:autotransporter-associated beta strand protein